MLHPPIADEGYRVPCPTVLLKWARSGKLVGGPGLPRRISARWRGPHPASFTPHPYILLGELAGALAGRRTA